VSILQDRSRKGRENKKDPKRSMQSKEGYCSMDSIHDGQTN